MSDTKSYISPETGEQKDVNIQFDDVFLELRLKVF